MEIQNTFDLGRAGKTTGSLEEVLCLSTLIAVKYLKWNATLEDSKEFQQVTTCENCAFDTVCLACIINE